MTQEIDTRIKQAQRKGAGVYILSGFLTLIIMLGFTFWLFLIKGYTLSIGPEEATNNAEVELLSGFAWVGDRKIYTLGGDINIKVIADTFESVEMVIDHQSPSTIDILLLPSPAVITGQATTNGLQSKQIDYLAQSQWFLNGKLIHVGSKFSHKTPPGKYQLDVSNQFYESASVLLDLARAEQIAVSPVLGVVNGSITINSDPQGIDVSIDDLHQGKTPLTFLAQGGQYQVTLTSEQFKTVADNVAISTGFLQPKRNYQLVPKLGELRISARPNDGLLLINNIEYKLGTIELPANRQHKIEYKKLGHSNFTEMVTLNKVEPTTMQVELKPLYGEVILNTNVPALISISGGVKEESPLSKRLLSIEHTVEVSSQGYRTVKQTFVPKPNKSLKIDIQLMTEFEARRKEGKPLFVNTLGIKLQKFTADAFTLGSPANETGRRRNEHQIEVEFARQFWVSEKEITQTQFSASLGAKQTVKSNLPITGVSWLEAAQYTNWLSQQEGLPPFYRFQNGRYTGVNVSSNGYRLPTEAEWEWLAKKSKRATSTLYVWGNQEKLRDNVGNFADKTMNGKQLIFFDEYTDGKTGVAEVGSFKADRAGLYDLDGNVSEWVHDYYTNTLPDTSNIYIDYLGSPRGESWVIKGGSYETGRLRELRGAYREYSVSGKATVGFRIARYDDEL